MSDGVCQGAEGEKGRGKKGERKGRENRGRLAVKHVIAQLWRGLQGV